MPKVKDMYAVILAGGSGERFWPMSTTSRPKQFLSIPAGKPLICAAVERVENLIPKKQIFIITRQDLFGMVRRVMPKFPKENIIGEPCGRDTAAAVALGAAIVKRRNPKAAFCVLTADQVIGNRGVFLKTLRESFRLALSSDYLVTIGIKPDFASTGFGYVEAGRKLYSRGAIGVFKVKRFVEKPDKKTAVKYLKKGSFYWNSGMFIWSVAVLEKAIAAHRPQLTHLIRTVTNVTGAGSFQKALKKEYAKLEKISVDYAVLEKADNIVMIRSNFLWDDVGSWAALEKHCRKDKSGNIILGRGEALDARNNIAVAEDGVVALIGVRGLVVVRSGAATLVCSKAKVQDVKKMVALMKSGKKYKGII
ncbi:mannose-1-phosphate guanylyltransferase [Verrucomicrobiota bacterium]